MEELISIIVPVYKVEKYLSKCVNSILNQTYKNIEIILVDDGSPDGCPEICKQYAEQYSQVRVIHQENQGLSAARNCGIDYAKGKYIAFVDSDDAIHERMYEILYHDLIKCKADIAVCKFKYISESEEFHCDTVIEDESISVYSGQEALGNIYKEDSIPTIVVWNKLYKKEMFNKNRFKVGKTHEDEFIIHRLLDGARKVVYTDTQLYYYLQRDTSITGGGFSLKRLDHVEAIKDRMDFFEERGYDALFEKVYIHYLETIINHYMAVKEYFPDEKGIADNLKNVFIKSYEREKVKNSPIKTRLKYYLFYLQPILYRLTIKLSEMIKVMLSLRQVMIHKEIIKDMEEKNPIS